MDRAQRVDIKSALDGLIEVSSNLSDASSDFSVDDNDRIYGVPEPILKCNKCSRTFINIISLKRHEKLHIEQNFSCNECGKRFSFLEDLKLHKQSHQSDISQEDDDMYVIKDSDEIVENDTVNSSNSVYVRCKLCLKVMKKESYLSHKMMHRKERKIVCNFCSSKFRKQDHLRKHMMKVHNRSSDSSTSLNSFLNETVSLCTTCNKTFQNESNLTAHMQVHFPQGFKQHIPQDPPQYCCQHCNSKFDCGRDLKLHITDAHLTENQYLQMK